MALARIWYVIFYVMYLALLAVTIWFLLYYSNVPAWVFFLFLPAIILTAIALIVKETLLTTEVLADGTVITSPLSTFWKVLYYLHYVIAVVLIVVGILFVVSYSTVPWWVWMILGLSWILSLISSLILTISSAGAAKAFSIFISLAATIAYIAGIILLVLYSNAPWWVWLLAGGAYLMYIVASVLENLSRPNTKLMAPVTSVVSDGVTETTAIIGYEPVYGQPSILLDGNPQNMYSQNVYQPQIYSQQQDYGQACVNPNYQQQTMNTIQQPNYQQPNYQQTMNTIQAVNNVQGVPMVYGQYIQQSVPQMYGQQMNSGNIQYGTEACFTEAPGQELPSQAIF